MRTTLVAALLLTLARAAQAQTGAAEVVPPPPAPPVVEAPTARVDEASWRAMLNRWVHLQLNNGADVYGQLIAVESATVTLIAWPGKEVVSHDRVSIVRLRAADVPAEAAPKAERPPPATAEPARERHFGVLLGIAPAVNLDVDYGLFYGFANVSLVFPMATSGRWMPMSFGAGVSFPLGRGWKFDVFAYYAPNRVDNGSNGNEEWIHAAGVGVGVHYTMENGFTVGFKAPILGYSADVGTVGSTSTGAGVGNYYLASACGLPLFFLGYRL